MKNNIFTKKEFLIIVFLLLLPIVQAKAEISVEQVGYGKNNNEVYFNIFNTGDVLLNDVAVWVDGTVRSVGGKISPGKGFELFLFLQSGSHFIEVNSSEGAYDSLNISIASFKERPKPPEIEEKKTSFLEENKLLIVSILIVLIIVILFLLSKKPKLKLLSFVLFFSFFMLVNPIFSACTRSNPCCCENKCWVSGVCCKKGTPNEHWDSIGCYDFETWVEPNKMMFTIGRRTPINLYVKNTAEYDDIYNVSYWLENINPALISIDLSTVTPTDEIGMDQTDKLVPIVTVLSMSASGSIHFNITSWGNPNIQRNATLSVAQSNLPLSLEEFSFPMFLIFIILIGFLYYLFMAKLEW